ncbi:MAG TPA: hypothetical protein VF262_03555, partial [Burkholderiales bacterium]
MKRLILVSILALAGCAGFDGRNLVAGQSTEQDAVKEMGRPALELKLPNGDKALYFSRLPEGRAIFKATFSPDGVLRGIQPTLTRENV